MKTGEGASSRGFESHPLRFPALQSPPARCALLLATLASAFGPALLHAQDTATVVPLPALRVTVLRTMLPLERAVSAARLDSARVQRQGPGRAVSEALQGLAGVQADDRHNQALGERLSIRGFGARSTFGIRGVRVLVDGIPATMPDGQTTLNHVDPGRIVGAELVRGAAGAFLGNAAGGALQLHTGAGPAPGVEVVAGGGELRRLGAGFGSSRGSAYGSWQREAGQRAYSAAERGILGGVFSASTRLGQVEAAVHGTRYEAENPGSLTAEQVAADPTLANPGNVRQRTSERGTHVQAGLGWEQAVGDVAMEVRGHAGIRDVHNPIPPRIIELDRTFGGVRAQAAWLRPGYQLAGGADLELQADDRQNFVNESGERGALVLDQRERVTGAGWFAQGAWSPVAAWELFAALRRDAYRFRVADRLVTATNPDDSDRRTLSATSLAGGAGFRPVSGIELFANVSTSFETPTTTELANRPDGAGGFNPELQPERTLAGEAGLRLSRARWGMEATAFRAGVRDKLIPYEVPTVPGRQFFRNAGRARHQGVELSARAAPHRTLELRAAYTRLDVRFQRYQVAGEDLAGRRVPGVAGHRLDFEAAIRAAPLLEVSLRALRNGSVAVNDANDAAAAPYLLLGARVEHRGIAAGPITLGAYAGVENALDRRYTAAVSVNAAGSRYYEPGPGRTGYIALRFAPRGAR